MGGKSGENLTRVAIGLGSNVGDRLGYLELGWHRLWDLLTDARISRVFETSPQHFELQPLFLNACCVGETDLSPHELLLRLQSIEEESGRACTGVRYGPRTLDLDLLLYGNRVLRDVELTIPHRYIVERAFVLEPLREIAGTWIIPGTDLTVQQAAARIDAVGVHVTDYSFSSEVGE